MYIEEYQIMKNIENGTIKDSQYHDDMMEYKKLERISMCEVNKLSDGKEVNHQNRANIRIKQNICFAIARILFRLANSFWKYGCNSTTNLRKI